MKNKLEQRIAVTHLKFRASFPTSICIEVINYSSSKYYSTKPTFSVTQQTRQLCERFRCPLIQYWPFNFDVFLFVICDWCSRDIKLTAQRTTEMLWEVFPEVSRILVFDRTSHKITRTTIELLKSGTESFVYSTRRKTIRSGNQN